MSYIARRPAKGLPPSDVIEHDLALHSVVSALEFPAPEAPWLSRDVTREDWRVFTEQLGLRSGAGSALASDTPAESDAARHRRINYVVEEWNVEFFKPRGLKVTPVFEDTTKDKKEDSKGNGFVFGFKAGNTIIGISSGLQANGYGLRLPGNVLVGVAKLEEKKT
ncbi:hypothetical protein OQA88_10798 [Cercophora sp. LCS_1]